jgi:hypothetical protein
MLKRFAEVIFFVVLLVVIAVTILPELIFDIFRYIVSAKSIPETPYFLKIGAKMHTKFFA